MIVVGGCYHEQCIALRVDDVFGSGGRAAVALADAGNDVDWYFYCPPKEAERVRIQLARPHLNHHSVPSDSIITFRYFHPLSKPLFFPDYGRQYEPIKVQGDIILRFGFMEGSAEVHGKHVVYDPQSHNHPISFRKNGSTADRLAIVLNENELLSYGQSEDEIEIVKQISENEGAEIVLVKAGVHGCRVYEQAQFIGKVPPYASGRVYKIGSGDIFTAAFTHHWACLNWSTLEAADAASRCTARYCETRLPNVTLDEATLDLDPVNTNKSGRVYLASPFFTISELWLVEETWSAFTELGVDFFSPYHEVGPGKPQKVVEPNLEGLRSCTAVLAFIDNCDPGTLFEIGYAVQLGISVVALSQNPKESDQTMILGSQNCFITDDYATAVYRAAWESCK